MQLTVQIPVAAASERAAIKYLNSTDEWKSDSAFDDFGQADGADISVAGADRVSALANIPDDWYSDCFCWGSHCAEDITVAQAFFDEELKQMRPTKDLPDDEYEDAWLAHDRREKELLEEFDEARQATG